MSDTPSAKPSLALQSGDAPAPLYAQVKALILRNIRSGAWPPNSRVPSESELVVSLGISRMTINRAIRELTGDGLLTRMQGVGTFVAEPKGHSALFAVNNIRDEITARGHEYHCELIVLEKVSVNGSVANALDMRDGQTAFHSRIVHFENGLPVQLEDRHVVPALAPDYLKQDFTSTTPYAYLSRVAPLTEGEHIVEAILASSEECQLLKLDKTEPCLLIRRKTWSGPRPVSVARLIHPGSRHRLEGRFKS